MSTMATNNVKVGRAFAVRWDHLDKWDLLTASLAVLLIDRENHLQLKHIVTVRKEVLPLDEVKAGRAALLDRVSFAGEVHASNSQSTKMDQYACYPGDLVVSKIRARQGSIGIVPADSKPLGLSIHYRALKPNADKVDIDYLWLALRSELGRRQFLAATGGASKGEISEEALLSIRIPLPPLESQLAIVAQWQTGMGRASELEAEAVRMVAEAQRGFLEGLGIATRAYPHSATRGFALQWNDITTWHGSSNLKRLAMGDVHDGRYAVQKGRQCLTGVANGCSASPVTQPTGLEVLPISCVTKGYLDLSVRKHIPAKEQYRSAFALKKGDVLICRTNGTLAYVGMSALVEEDHPELIYPDKVIRLRPAEHVLPHYLWLVLQTPPLRAQIEAAARTAVGNYAIGGADVWNFEIPIPPKALQEKLAQALIRAKAEAVRLKEQAEELRRKTRDEVEGRVMGKDSGRT